jgi:poly-gamma-glutamate capsule biosynthesis protein CapA/YwtB (metallophosphatase superfamily)
MSRAVSLVRVAAGAIAGLALLLGGWYAYWTYYDPDVDVPSPEVLQFPSLSGGQSGRVLFLGDFAPTDHALPLLKKHGWGYPYQKTRALLAGYDAVVANLESPVTASDDPWPVPKKWVYKVDPEAVPAMRRAGIDVVTLANNHTHDYGRRGLADTLRHLSENGTAHLGAGLSERRARRGLVLETAGGRLGLLSYMQNKDHWRFRDMAYALDTPFRSWSGVARLRYSDLAEDIERMRRSSDAVVVAVHWGRNYKPISRFQETLGRACVELGADAVIGHHPHQYQPVGIHDGRPIIYSIGNYAFGTLGRKTMRFGMGAALHLEHGQIRAVELIPLLTQNRIVRYQTRLPRGERLDRFFEGLLAPSAERGASIERRGSRGWLSFGGAR